MGNELIADLHKEWNFGLQKKVLVPFLQADAFIIPKLCSPATNCQLKRLLWREGEQKNQ